MTSVSHPPGTANTATAPARRKTVLVTGAAGYLGRALCNVLAEDFDLLRMDIRETPGPGQFLCGSVTDRAALQDACERVDALVLGHMAPNRTDAYDWPDTCLDINVKGVALALEAAARAGIKRVVLISSINVVGQDARSKTFLSRALPSSPMEMYGMTKVLQEEVARYYQRCRGLEIAALRPAYVLDEDSMVNKYGENAAMASWQCIDPRDIGRAAAAALKLGTLAFEIFYLMAGPGAEDHADIAFTKTRLGWNPLHRFEGKPLEQL